MKIKMNLKLLIYFYLFFKIIQCNFIYLFYIFGVKMENEILLKFKYALKNTLNTWEKKNKTKSW